VDLIKYGIEPILIGGACAFVCACYLVYIALRNNLQFHKFKLRWHFINLMASNQMEGSCNEGG